MKDMLLSVLTATAVILLSGCVTAPAPQGQTYSATYVGDRASIPLSEVVLTIGLQQPGVPNLCNLHVQLDVLVNPKDLSLASVYEVNDIVRRLGPRIHGRITDLVPVGKSVSLQSLPALKEEIAREADAAFSTAYAKWAKASAFGVRIAVTSFYLTDLSGGAAARSRSDW